MKIIKIIIVVISSIFANLILTIVVVNYFLLPKLTVNSLTFQTPNSNIFVQDVSEQRNDQSHDQMKITSNENIHKLGNVYCIVKKTAQNYLLVDAYADDFFIKNSKKELNIHIEESTEFKKSINRGNDFIKADFSDIKSGDTLLVEFDQGYLLNEINEVKAKEIIINTIQQ